MTKNEQAREAAQMARIRIVEGKLLMKMEGGNMKKLIELRFVDAEGEYWQEVKLPTKFIVCHRCQGRGVHDAWEGGMTMDEMYEQGPDFIDDYFDGVYDVACSVCRGQRVLEVVDEDRVPADLKEAYAQHKQREYEYAEERAFEDRMRRYGREW